MMFSKLRKRDVDTCEFVREVTWRIPVDRIRCDMTEMVGLTERKPEIIFRIFCAYHSSETALEVKKTRFKHRKTSLEHAILRVSANEFVK